MATTRKRPTKSDAPKPDTPAPVHFNLDTIEREGERQEPFNFVLDGRRFSTKDPADIDWREFAALNPDDVAGVLRTMLGAEAYVAFRADAQPMWKVNRLALAIVEHYGLLPGEAGASSGS